MLLSVFVALSLTPALCEDHICDPTLNIN